MLTEVIYDLLQTCSSIYLQAFCTNPYLKRNEIFEDCDP